MKQRYLYLLFFCSIFQILKAQPNLIPNPSFEIIKGCPTRTLYNSHELGMLLENWKADDAINPPIGRSPSPDYFNSCASVNTNVSVPQNTYGTQTAKEGNAYVGIFFGYGTFYNLNPAYHVSEYIFTELTQTLVANQTYNFSMYVSQADNARFNYSANQLGAAFLTKLPFAGSHITTNTLALKPQILETNVIGDKINWTKIEGVFTAKGGEKYVIIGHFPNPKTLKVEVNGIPINYTNEFESYYYIDDISLKSSNLSTNVFNGKDVKLFPNPAKKNVLIEGIEVDEIKAITVFDINGKKVTVTLNNNSIDISRLSSGIYILKIETQAGLFLTEKIIKN